MKDMNIYTVNAKCPSCGKQSPFELHTLMDPIKDPQATRKLLSSEYFTHVCPHCHQVQPLSYSCMYHDGTKKLLVAYGDNEKDYNDMKVSLTSKKKDTKLDEVLTNWLENCDVRLVKDVFSLQEKVLLSHLKLDDKIIEIARFLKMQELKASFPEMLDLYFNTDGDDYVFLVVEENGIREKVPFTKEEYESIQKEYQNKIISDQSIEIDLDWAKSIVEGR